MIQADVLAGGEQNPAFGAPVPVNLAHVVEIHDRRSMQAGVIVGRFDPLDIVRERDDNAAGTLTAFSGRGQIAIGRCQSQSAGAASYFGVARKA
jgi:hypothetical protein